MIPVDLSNMAFIILRYVPSVPNLLRVYLFIYLFIYLFMAALGLHCCTRAFSSCGEQGLLFAVVCRLLNAVASLVVEHRL